MSTSTKEHWNKVYTTKSVKQLGWYEVEPEISLKMIENCAIDKNESILDVGAGATTLIDYLVEHNYTNIIALDISEAALEKLRTRLGAKKSSQVQMLVDDITNPTAVLDLKGIAIWHDRALLHFLVEGEQQQAYLDVLKKVVRAGGNVIIATFSKRGASKCSGLKVERYDYKSLAALLGDDFELREYIDYEYQMPSGAMRPFVYARFQREA